MKKTTAPRHVSETEWTWTLLGLAFLFGAFARWLPARLAKFPINDGGMFAVMMRDLSANQFALPAFTSYNNAAIPFAYPPLGIYLGALLSVFGIAETQTLLWLPALLAIAILPLFYLLAFELLENRPRAAVATIFFALTPGNYVWYLMGGGLTRALGAIFFILSLYFVHRAFRETNRRSTIFATLCCALVVLSHPQAALLTVTGCATFWLFGSRSRVSIFRAFIIAVGALALASPWWATVITRHGVETFLSAGQSGGLQASFSALAESLFERKTILPFSTLFWLLGLGWALYIRRFDLLLWGGLPYFIDQRTAPIAASFLYPMLAAYGALDVLPGLIRFLRARKWTIETDNFLFNQRALSMTMLGIAFYLFIECVFHTTVIRNLSLPPAARQTLTWASRNTPASAKFLILTGHTDVMTDPMQEWFPALTARHSATTLQGLEWTLQGVFILRWNQLSALQACQNIECIDGLTRSMNLKFDYVIVNPSRFPVEIFSSKQYETVFDNGTYIMLH